MFADIRYAAVLGNDFNGQGVSSAGGFIETFRMSACRLCAITNNTFQNASAGAATFKFHSGNTYDSRATWIGQYTELVEISDNCLRRHLRGAAHRGQPAERQLR